MKVDYMVAFSGIQKQEIVDKYGLDGGRTQKVIDNAFKSFMLPYMPMQDGIMIANTVIVPQGGEIDVNTPYAHYQHEGILYVNPKYNSTGFPFIINKKGKHVGYKGKRVPSGRKLNYHG